MTWRSSPEVGAARRVVRQDVPPTRSAHDRRGLSRHRAGWYPCAPAGDGDVTRRSRRGRAPWRVLEGTMLFAPTSARCTRSMTVGRTVGHSTALTARRSIGGPAKPPALSLAARTDATSSPTTERGQPSPWPTTTGTILSFNDLHAYCSSMRQFSDCEYSSLTQARTTRVRSSPFAMSSKSPRPPSSLHTSSHTRKPASRSAAAIDRGSASLLPPGTG